MPFSCKGQCVKSSQILKFKSIKPDALKKEYFVNNQRSCYLYNILIYNTLICPKA